jgi:predicted ABC-type ATPase
MPQLWVVAGPNGAGKSTLTRQYLVGRLPIVDPDAIARERDPADPTRIRVRVQAGREAIHQQEALLTARTDFAIETTLSGHREMDLLRRAKEAGYKITLVYIGVNSPDVSLGRVNQRVAEGGHQVPPQDVARRYRRGMANLATALQIVDRAFVLDNSGQRRRLLLSMERGQVKRRSRNLPRWV